MARHRTLHMGLVLTASVLITGAIFYGSTAVAAPSDPTIFRSTPIAGADTGRTASQIADPSVATDGTTVFFTYNYGAAISSDAGATFKSVDPTQIFPTDAVFCCEQRVLYEPSRGLFFWALEYGPKPNFVRLAAASPANALRGRWAYWDFHNTDVKELNASSGMGYPQLAASQNYLYLTVLGVTSSPTTPGGAGIIRLSLDELFRGARAPSISAFAINSVETALEVITPVQGASTTMYFGQNATTTATDLIVWPESGAPSTLRITRALTVSRAGTCIGPNGRDPCAFASDVVQSGWVGRGAIGFAWTAGAGGAGGRLNPYVQVIRIDEATRTLIEQPTIESDSLAMIYPAASLNARGDLAVLATTVGRTQPPAAVAFLRDDVSGSTQWTKMTLKNSALSPVLDGWGFYQTVIPASPGANSWIAATWTIQGALGSAGGTPTNIPESQPALIAFGRERDDPRPPSPGLVPAAPTSTPAVSAAPTPAQSAAPSPSSTPPPSPAAAGRCAASTGAVGQRVAAFWQCVDALSASDVLLAADLGQWARNVIELDPSACTSVADFRSSAAAMQGAMDAASIGIPASPPRSADVETRIAAFWTRVDQLGPLDYLAAGDLGQWALNVIDRDPSRRIRVDAFRSSTATMQAAFDRAKAAGAACR